MAILKWTPHQNILNLPREMSRFFGRPFVSLFDEPDTMFAGLGPAMDVFTRGNDMILRMELPGIETDGLDISLSEHSLTISGERKAESEVKEGDFLHRERSWGRFERSLPVPEKITENDISASYEDGVLEVTVMGAVTQEPVKHITVKARGEKKTLAHS
ncbi:MAG: Hsp20/alpha crystallin family protein [Thermoleophilia bacterium]